jgi:hypothetical protein
LNTTGSDFDTLLAVYTGNSVSNLLQVAANDDSGGGLTSAVIFDALSGTNYWIAVDGYEGATGAIVLNLAVTFAPLIASQPQSQAAFIGGIAQFSVGATGASPLSYQWRFGGTNIAGATSSVLALNGVQGGQAGPYSVVVSNGYGANISSNAWLSVSPVAAWGDDGSGQTDVPGLTNVVAVAGGLYHSLALSGQGTVMAWGIDAFGQSDVRRVLPFCRPEGQQPGCRLGGELFGPNLRAHGSDKRGGDCCREPT